MQERPKAFEHLRGFGFGLGLSGVVELCRIRAREGSPPLHLGLLDRFWMIEARRYFFYRMCHGPQGKSNGNQKTSNNIGCRKQGPKQSLDPERSFRPPTLSPEALNPNPETLNPDP